MNRLIRIITSAFVAGIVCSGLKLFPCALLEIMSGPTNTHNELLSLTMFLSLSFPGLWTSMILGFWAKRQIRQYAVVVTWGAAALFAVAFPAPAILSYRWGDKSTLWAICFAVIAGGVWGWRLPQNREAQQVSGGNGG